MVPEGKSAQLPTDPELLELELDDDDEDAEGAAAEEDAALDDDEGAT